MNKVEWVNIYYRKKDASGDNAVQISRGDVIRSYRNVGRWSLYRLVHQSELYTVHAFFDGWGFYTHETHN